MNATKRASLERPEFDYAGEAGVLARDVLGADFTDHFTEVNGIRMHYVAGGSGERILFIHGFPTFWYTWRNQLRQLSRDHQVIAPDMRGYNLTSKPMAAPHYGVRIIVEDLRNLVEHLGGEPVFVVGEDWGGLIAWAFALYHPHIVKKLIILSSPHPAIFDRELRANSEHQIASQYLLSLRATTADKLLGADDFDLLRQAILGLPFYSDKDRELYLRVWRQPDRLNGGINWYREAWLGPPSEDGISSHGDYVPDITDKTVRVPTLVIKAGGSPYFLDSTLDGLEDYVPDLIVRRLESSSHWIAEEKPEEVNSYIREFISTPVGK
jgi:pimeloyl-ACP methyl ester carboxylesterase